MVKVWLVASLAMAALTGCFGQSEVQRVYGNFNRLEELFAQLQKPAERGAPKAEDIVKEIGEIANGMADKLVWSLESDSDDRKIIAAAALGFVESDRSVEALLDALNDPNPDVKANAAGSIGKLAPRNVSVERFDSMLDSSEPSVKSSALFAMANILHENDNRVDPIRFLKFLTDKDADVRNHALLLFASVGFFDAAQPIVDNVLCDKDPLLRENAVLVLGDLLSHDRYEKRVKRAKDSGSDVEKKVKDITAQQEAFKRMINPHLIDLLKDEKSRVVSAAAFALRRINRGEDHGRSHSYWRVWWDNIEKKNALAAESEAKKDAIKDEKATPQPQGGERKNP